MRRIRIGASFACSFVTSFSAQAYHGADITYTTIDLFSYSITVTHYANDFVDLPQILIDFGDGSQATVNRSPPQDSFSWPCEGLLRVSTYEVEHTYTSPGTYFISAPFQFRPNGVLNLPGPPPPAFCVYAMLRIDPALGANSSPRFMADMTETQRIGNVLHYAPGIEEDDGDSLSFSFETPLGLGCSPINGYLGFDLPSFPATSTTIDPLTGAYAWNHPYAAGLYAVLLRASEWRNGQLIGFASLDMMLCVTDDYLTDIPESHHHAAISANPNPGEGFRIQGLMHFPSPLMMVDAQGRVVLEVNITRYDEWVGTSSIPAGLYYIRATKPNGHTSILPWVKQ